MAPQKTSTTAKPGQFKRGRRPHNAAAPRDPALKDTILRIASEPRKVIIDGELRVITRAERIIRLTVARAVDGKVRDIAQLLKMMMDNPDLAASFRTETVFFVNGALARA